MMSKPRMVDGFRTLLEDAVLTQMLNDHGHDTECIRETLQREVGTRSLSEGLRRLRVVVEAGY